MEQSFARNHNEPSLSQEWYEAAMRHVELDAAASVLEEARSSFLSQLILGSDEKTNARAEAVAKASDEWRTYLKKMADAREAANRAKVEAEFRKMRYFEWQSKEANERVMARM